MTIIFGDSATFTGKALPKEDHTFHESINVDNGAVHIDPDHSSHVIRIEHDKGDGKDIFRAVDNATGTNTARIDSSTTSTRVWRTTRLCLRTRPQSIQGPSTTW